MVVNKDAKVAPLLSESPLGKRHEGLINGGAATTCRENQKKLLLWNITLGTSGPKILCALTQRQLLTTSVFAEIVKFFSRRPTQSVA